MGRRNGSVGMLVTDHRDSVSEVTWGSAACRSRGVSLRHSYGKRCDRVPTSAVRARHASADAFVFPSLTDTFGIVLLEALASGLPVAAFPVTGPLDVIGGTGAGALDTDLRAAALTALAVPRERCRAEALRYTWAESARQFYDNIAQAHALGPMHRTAGRPSAPPLPRPG